MSSETQLTPPPEQLAEILMHLRRTAPWHELARMLELAAGSELYSPPGTRSLVGGMCGLSVGVVGRYIAAYRRIRQIAQDRGIPMETLLSGSFNGCEVACRLYDRSGDQGFASLVGLREGSENLASVRRRLGEVAAPADSEAATRGKLLRQRGLEIEAVETALAASAERLFGRGSEVVRRPGLRLFRRVGFEVVARDGSVAAGLDLLTSQADRQRDELDEGFGASALLATHFPKFHYVVSPGSEPDIAARAVETVSRFGMRWFGVMRVEPDGGIEVLRPAKGRPDPDRTAQYPDLKKRYAIGRRNA